MHPNFPTSVIRPVTKKIASRHRNSPTFQFAMICLEISPSDYQSFRAEHSDGEKSFKDAYKTNCKDLSTAVV